MAATTDESHDIANISQQMNYYHGVNRSTGERITVFAGVQALPNGTSDSLREGLVQQWRDLEDRMDPSKNVALGCDGCNANIIGCQNGMAAQIKRYNPLTVVNHFKLV